MKIQSKTVCITGAAGFLGNYLCKKLVSKGAYVIALDNFSVGKKQNLAGLENKVEIIAADIMDSDSLREPLQRSEVIFHLAAIANPRTCYKNFDLALDINLKGSANVLSHCLQVERVIFLSSIMVYGEPKYLPIDESHPYNAHDPYAISKIMCEYLFKAYHHIHGIPHTIIRSSNIYGPLQNADYLIPTLIIQGLKQKKIEIWDPRVIRDFLYVDDAIEALLRVVESESSVGETINLGSGHGVAAGEVADIVCRLLGATWVDVKKPAPVRSKLIADISKIHALTGWKPNTSLEEGLRKTVEYHRSILN